MDKIKDINLKKHIVLVVILIVVIVVSATFIPLIFLLNGIGSYFSNVPSSKYCCMHEPYGITVDSLGNVYIVGESKPYGQEYFDTLLLKYNSSGSLLWNKTWDQGGTDIVSDSIGNTYIAGGRMLLKYNLSGHLQWNTTWDITISSGGNRIIMDHLENIYIMGSTQVNRDVSLLKYDSNGTLQWYRILEDPNHLLLGRGIATDGLGNIYITGQNESDSYNTFTLKYNSFGDLQWKRVWGGSEYENSDAIVSDSSGNIYVTGQTSSYSNKSQSYMLKYSTTGDLQWYKLYNIYTSGNFCILPPNDIKLDPLGNLYTISYTDRLYESYASDVLLSKLDSSGNVLWNKTWEKPDTNEYGIGIELDNSGNIYAIAPSRTYCDPLHNSDIILLKFNSSGDFQWNRTWGDQHIDSGDI